MTGSLRPCQTPTRGPVLATTAPVLTLTLDQPGVAQRPDPVAVAARWRRWPASRSPPEVRVVVIRGGGGVVLRRPRPAMLAPGAVCRVRPTSSSRECAEGADDTIAGFQRGFSVWRSRCRPWSSPRSRGTRSAPGSSSPSRRPARAGRRRPVRDAGDPLGLVPDLGGTGPLVHLVGYARALEICATGRFVGAREASPSGWPTSRCRVTDLEAATADLVAALLATPEAALRALKPLLADAVQAGAGRTSCGGAGGSGPPAARLCR